MTVLKNKNIAVYLTGGIAVYKMANIVRSLIKKGAHVRVAMTSAATEFIRPLTFQVLTQASVLVDNFSEDNPQHVAHIELADWSDFALVAPATANTLSKMSQGIADNMVTSALLATDAPIFLVPAMNEKMLEHFAVQENIDRLKAHGYYVMDPDTGFLAEGYEGKGRFPEEKRIIDELEMWIIQQSDLKLSGKRIIVSAGGTQEKIDPVRYITNRSSGQMGHALAEVAFYRGAEVELVTTSALSTHLGIHVTRVKTARDMHQTLADLFPKADGLIMSAAVSDYRPKRVADQKIKKHGDVNGDWAIELTENPDILKDLSAKKRADQWTVGFAAETENIEHYAKKKIVEKRIDMIVANDVSMSTQGFDSDQNAGTLYFADGSSIEIPVQSKKEMATVIMGAIEERFYS